MTFTISETVSDNEKKIQCFLHVLISFFLKKKKEKKELLGSRLSLPLHTYATSVKPCTIKGEDNKVFDLLHLSV